MPYILQGGLGMPEREYYLSDDPPRWQPIATAYREYIADMLPPPGSTMPPPGRSGSTIWK